MGAEVITVSTDTQFVHLAWQNSEKELRDVKYPMGADPTGKLSRQFGVYDENTGLALRGTFIISPDGTLFNSEVNFYNLGRNIDELMRKFKANLYLSNVLDERPLRLKTLERFLLLVEHRVRHGESLNDREVLWIFLEDAREDRNCPLVVTCDESAGT